MKRLFSILLVLVLCFSVGLTAFAEEIEQEEDFCPMCESITTFAISSEPSCVVLYNNYTSQYIKFWFYQSPNTYDDFPNLKLFIYKDLSYPNERFRIAIQNPYETFSDSIYLRVCTGDSLDNMSSHQVYTNAKYYYDEINDVYYGTFYYNQLNEAYGASNYLGDVDLTGITDFDSLVASVDTTSFNLYRYTDDLSVSSGKYDFFTMPPWIAVREQVEIAGPQMGAEAVGTMRILTLCGVGLIALLLSLPILSRVWRIFRLPS